MNFTLAFKGFSPEVTHINSFHTLSVKASHGIMPKFNLGESQSHLSRVVCGIMSLCYSCEYPVVTTCVLVPSKKC